MNMAYGDYPVEILNERGEVVGSKPRKDIDRVGDILHASYVFALTPNKQAAFYIIQNKGLATLYVGTYACPAAILRVGEDRDAGARRALHDDFGVEDTDLQFLGEKFLTYADGVRRLMAGYVAFLSDAPQMTADGLSPVITMPHANLAYTIQSSPELFSAGTLAFWEAFGTQLPF